MQTFYKNQIYSLKGNKGESPEIMTLAVKFCWEAIFKHQKPQVYLSILNWVGIESDQTHYSSNVLWDKWQPPSLFINWHLYTQSQQDKLKQKIGILYDKYYYNHGTCHDYNGCSHLLSHKAITEQANKQARIEKTSEKIVTLWLNDQ